jgi:hypothetical protein
MLTYVEGTSDLTRTLYKSPGAKIISFLQRDDKAEVYILDENLNWKVFEYVYEYGKVTKLKYKKDLEMTETTKGRLENYKESMFTDFHRCHMSADYGFHIKDEFYMLHADPKTL